MGYKTVDMKKAFKLAIVKSSKSQAEIAEDMGFSPERLSRLINKERANVRLGDMEAFCLTMCLSVSELVRLGEE